MIVLNATPELKLTFDKLIRTMEAKVSWNGLFIVIDNTLILQGDVRSLFFHFDSKKVVTNFIDLDIQVQQITPIENNDYVKNVINMLLYAFGKWGNIKGLTVEKNYAQLGSLFKNILGEMGIEPDYNKEHFWFYQNGVRILYEDVVECAVSYEEKDPEIPEEESRGLWHKLVWKQCFEEFSLQKTTPKERNRNRMGYNFYVTGYLCPVCASKMYGVVYPAGKEFIVDTNEGRVRLARAYTCEKCNCFYTPRPGHLLVDGDCYRMDFENDRAAYQDYLELLGENGARVSNPNYNSYVDRKNSGSVNTLNNGTRTPLAVDRSNVQNVSEEWALAEFREMTDKIEQLPEREMEIFLAKVEEGFYPDKAVALVERLLWQKYEKKPSGNHAENMAKSSQKAERYRTRLNLFQRLSQRQRQELIKQIIADSEITESVRAELLERAGQLKRQDNYEQLKEKVAEAGKKNRLVMLRVYGEIEAADLDENKREELFEQTGVGLREYREYESFKKSRNTSLSTNHTEEKADNAGDLPERKSVELKKEAKAVKKLKLVKEPKAVKKLKLKKQPTAAKSTEMIKRFPKAGEVKTGTVQNQTRDKEADALAIEAMIRQTKSAGRIDLQQLLDNLLSQGFDEETLAPYEEHVRAQIRRLDEAYLDSILGDMEQLSSEEGAEIYERIAEADILPELKANALKQLETRLSKMKTDECELLVQKLKKQMTEAGLKEPQRHHYYPAKRVLLKEATEEETAVIEYAVASYGAGIGAFEYPIWVADTSLKQTGSRGMFLTPEKLYYSNFTTSYHVPVPAIERIEAVTSLFGRGLYVYRKDGEKVKLPYAVETGELTVLAEVLDAFVKYLQEKPFSRKESYLAEENHEEICCFRCGYVYTGTDTCPKCGYKANK